MAIKELLFCLAGKHKASENRIRLLPEDGEPWMVKELIYCERCHKILEIGFFPPVHPNCRSQIIDPTKEGKPCS